MVKFTAEHDPKRLNFNVANGKNTSGVIQSEIIHILIATVLGTLSNKVNNQSDVSYYCITCNSMRNAVNFKSLSAIVRYSANATIPEHLTRSTLVSLIIPAFNPSLQGNDGTYTVLTPAQHGTTAYRVMTVELTG